jgi:hypothetical protein
MTFYLFLALDEIEQAEAVWAGVMIADRIEGEHRLILYQLDSFYIEIWYNMEDNEIQKVRSFENTEQLQPYLSQIDISVLNG